uniref:Uncharacterized protein n=1 Tax=Pristhesancus plagipennis TaxID=1955184 RepID=A0A2K8JSB1_PRIPG|nr:secreted hypothetical protein [Pristhesancus plagipennis]
MHMNQVSFIILMLMNASWAINHKDDEGKVLRVTSSNVGRQNIKLKNSVQSEKLMKVNNDSSDDEDKKTLAQQVVDGKYGLIQRELFSEPVKRPGILSYEVNPEVPKDNVNNLGGLMPEEIWLAENHLLVLKGGNLGGEGKWPPIDNYVAPRRQVKIPQNPKVPPPFPVQLTDGGPTQFIKSKNNSRPLFTGLYPGNDTYPGNLHAGNGYEPFPFLLPLPPPAAFFPGNVTELDEDDPRIFYPPPYDFVYPKDNSSFVPAGPLVPGIVVPPPPNFFSLLDKKTGRTKVNTTRTRPTRPPQRTTTTMPTVSSTTSTTTTVASSKPPKITTTIRITTTYKGGKAAKLPSPSPAATLSPNEIFNTLPPNTPVGDWIPIPAPRPFYISLKPYGIEEARHQPGWKLFNKTENKKNRFIDKYYSNFKPILKQNPLPLYIDSPKTNFVYYDQSQFNPTLTQSSVHTKSAQKLNNINYFHSPVDYFLQEKYKANNEKSPTTRKPPIYEYSYSAPGYGTIEAPKIGANFYDVSTPRPYDYNLYGQTAVSSPRPYDYNLYGQTDYPAVSTSRPYDYNLYGQTDYSAPIPYTQRPNNYDEITKKYFTLFGQKLSQTLTTASPHIKYRSSPAPQVSSVSGDARSVGSSATRQHYNGQSNFPLLNNEYYQDRIFYRSTVKPISYGGSSNARPLSAPRSPPRPIHQYDDYDEQPPAIAHSLHSDIAINYKQPVPTINPLAEYVAPYSSQSKPSARAPPSLISYQLPGTAGHFYFLTPQAE